MQLARGTVSYLLVKSKPCIKSSKSKKTTITKQGETAINERSDLMEKKDNGKKSKK